MTHQWRCNRDYLFLGEFLADHPNCRGCPIDPDPDCKPGEPCRVDLRLQGNAAARLYDILARHGVHKDNEMAELLGGSYIETNDGLIICVEHDGERTCNLAYDAIKNKLDYGARACE